MLRTTGWPKPALLLGIFAVLAVFAYAAGLHGGFVYDDWSSITANTDVQVKDGTAAEWWKAAIAFPSGTPPFRSLTMLTFAVNCYFGGLDPYGFKLTNLVLHLVNGLLLFLCLRSVFLLRRECAADDAPPFDEGLAAAAIAGLWLLLPINLTAVLYVVQRLESFATLFTFLGLWWYASARRRVWQGRGGALSLWVGVIACTGLGLLAKESGAMLPLYVSLIEFCLPRGRNRDGRFSRATLGLFVATLVVPFLIGMYWMWGRYISVSLLAGSNPFVIERLLTESRVIVDYIGWTLVPNLDSLTLYHDDIALSHGLLDPPTTLASIVALLALLGFALLQRRRRPLLALGVLWFFAGHLLTGTIVPLILAFEHRNYFPSAGLLLAAASAISLEGPLRKGQARIALVTIAALFYASVTWMRANEWSDPVRLATSEALKRPASGAAQFDYAQALLQVSMNTHSSEPANVALKVLDAARKLPGTSIHFEQSMITLLGESGYPGPPEVWTSLIGKLEKGAPDTNGVHGLARLNHCFSANQCKVEDRPLLAQAYVAALAHKPPSGALLSVHGEYAWYVVGDRAQAEADYREVARASPRDLAAKSNLIVVLIHEGKREEAQSMIDDLQRANHLGMLDGYIEPLKRTLDAVGKDPPKDAPGNG